MRDEDKTSEHLLAELQTLRALLERTEKSPSPERQGLPIERLPLAYILFDADNHVLYWNPAAERMFGYDREEMLGRVALDVFLPLPISEQVQEVLRRIRAGDMDAHCVNENRTKDGRTITCEWFNTPLVDPDGRFTGVFSLAQDIAERKRVEEALRQSESRLRRVVESNMIGILIWDKVGRVKDANEAFLRTVGYSRDDLRAGRVRWSDMTPPEYRDLDEQGFAELRLRGVATPFEKEYVRKDGQRVPVMVGGALFEDSTEQGVAFVLDMSARKRAEAALRESEERFRNAFDHAPAGMYPCGLEGRWLKVTSALCQIVGYTENELLATTWKDITHPDDLEPDLAHARRLLAGEAAYYHMQKRYFHKDGHVVWILLGGSLVRDPQRRPLYFVGHVQDITERKNTEDRLRDYSERVQALSRRLLTAQEDERRHLARELHDEFGQVLGAVNFQLHAAKGLAGAAALPRLEECSALLQQAGDQVRSLTLELRPTMLDTLGLKAALRWLAERQEQRTGSEVLVDAVLSGPPPSADLAVACFRVAQEALTNVVRHAQARHVSIELRQDESVLELDVRDDGVGFDVTPTQEQAARRGSLGLLGMAERVHLHGGTLQVESEPGRGTRIRASLPLSALPEPAADPEE